MRERKRKLIFIQSLLLIIGILIIFYTYYNKNNKLNKQIISRDDQKNIEKKLANEKDSGNVFYDIEYSGIDLGGNRYILKSKEAFNNNQNQEIINMKFVEATFYFKDDTTLFVWSDKGVYNNRTLDMKFEGSVVVNYQESELYAKNAEYSNLKGFITISEDVLINDSRGRMVADKLLFDIKKKTLNVQSLSENKINADIKLK